MIRVERSPRQCEALLPSFKVIYSHSTVPIPESDIPVLGVKLRAEDLGTRVA
jgi:hypothetical protein